MEFACHTSVGHHEVEQECGHTLHQSRQSLPQRFVQFFLTNQKVHNLAKFLFDVDLVVLFFGLELTNFCDCLPYFIFLEGFIEQQSVQEPFEVLQVPF